MVPGHEQCAARLSPDGVLELRIGAHSHGQGLETTLAQVAHEILGVDPDNVRLVHGDTALTPYSTGTWGSRCMVMSGGAVATACKEIAEARHAPSPAQLLEVAGDELRARATAGCASNGSDRCDDARRSRARLVPRSRSSCRADVDPAGLEAIGGLQGGEVDTGTFSYACHAVRGRGRYRDSATVEILDYVVVEDGGTLVNPMVVDGQVFGGAAQGIGTALYEEMPYDAQGQPLASTLADYMLPGATEVPAMRIVHMETPSPLYGVRPERHRRGRRDRPAGRDRERGERRARATLGVEMHRDARSRRAGVLAAIAAARASDGHA